MTQDSPPPRRSRLPWIIGAGVGIIIVALYVAGWFFTGDRVPNGTTVAGVAIGGLSAAEAQDKLDQELADRGDRPIQLTVGDERADFRPDDVGMFLNTIATVEDAGAGRSWNPVDLFDSLFGDGGEVEPTIEFDGPSLDQAIAAFADDVDRDAAEPTVTFDAEGDPSVTQPIAGVTVDREAAALQVVDAYLRADTVELSAEETAPEVGKAALDKALDELAGPATSGPIVLDLPGRKATLKVADFAPALSLVVEDGALTPKVDERELGKRMADVVSDAGGEPVDARVEIRGGTPVVVPAKPGVTIEPAEVADAIVPVLTKTGKARRASVGESAAQPDFTTKDAKALNITEVVSEFVTYYPYAEYRNINQGRAAELINGTILKPDEVFSFNDTVGERTEENGFVVGFIISNGVFAEDLGGGVSQVVTTTYNASFFAGMEDIEHKPHSFYIDRYPMGREATVAWPTVDLKFRNTTPHGVLIEAWVVPGTVSSQGEMHVRMWSTKYWDITAGLSDQYDFTSPGTRYDPSDECVATTGYGGFEVDVTRTFRRAGSDEVVDRETQHVTYIPADTVICSMPPRN